MGHSFAKRGALPPASIPAVQLMARAVEPQWTIAMERKPDHSCCPLLRASTAPAQPAVARMTLVRPVDSAKTSAPPIAKERSSGPCWHLQHHVGLVSVMSASTRVWLMTWLLAQTSRIAMVRNFGHFPPLLRQSLAAMT